MCLAQGHNAVTLVRLKPATPRSRVKHSTTEPLHSLLLLVLIGSIKLLSISTINRYSIDLSEIAVSTKSCLQRHLLLHFAIIDRNLDPDDRPDILQKLASDDISRQRVTCNVLG